MTAESVPRKWRKSIFSFGIGWPNATKVSDPPASTPSEKRHNSVSFAPSPTSPTTIRAERRARGYSTQSWRSSGPALHHGSVQSLVIRQKSLKRPPITSATLGRRPSIPSLPMAIVHAFTGRLRQGSSTFSLDEEDSAFCSGDSACSSSSSSSSFYTATPTEKRNSGMSTFSGTTETNTAIYPTIEWSAEQRAKIQSELEARCAHSFGHHLVKSRQLLSCAKPMEMRNDMEDGKLLCAEGTVQFHLLSMMAQPGERVVNVGRNCPEESRMSSSPSLRPYHPSSLQLVTI